MNEIRKCVPATASTAFLQTTFAQHPIFTPFVTDICVHVHHYTYANVIGPKQNIPIDAHNSAPVLYCPYRAELL